MTPEVKVSEMRVCYHCSGIIYCILSEWCNLRTKWLDYSKNFKFFRFHRDRDLVVARNKKERKNSKQKAVNSKMSGYERFSTRVNSVLVRVWLDLVVPLNYIIITFVWRKLNTRLGKKMFLFLVTICFSGWSGCIWFSFGWINHLTTYLFLHYFHSGRN